MKLLLTLISLFSSSAFSYQNLVLISAPGSGKGTLSQYLVKQHNYAHIGAGDLVRAEIASESELGKQIAPIVNAGDYLPEQLMCAIIEKHLLAALKEQKRFILDGFPRSTFSIEFLDQFLIEHKLTNQVCFIQLLAEDIDYIERITNRQVCPSCFHVYNLKTSQPKVENICDHCQNNLTTRVADTLNIIRKRLTYFHNQIEPLLNLISQKYPVIRIDASQKTLLELTQEYEQIINK